MSHHTIFPSNGFYYHYKHDPRGEINVYAYEVLGIARHTETKELTVLYRPLYENEWFKPVDYQSRPLDMFLESVEKDGVKIKRFTQIVDPEIINKLMEIRAKMYKK